MSEQEIESMQFAISQGQQLAWIDCGIAQEITSVVPCIDSDSEEMRESGPCAILKSGGWIALENVDSASIYIIRRLIP